MVGKPIMTPGYVAANFAIKAGYFFDSLRQPIFDRRNGRRTHRRIIISRLSPRGHMIFVPAESGSASTVEMVTIDPQDLQAAQELDLNHGA